MMDTTRINNECHGLDADAVADPMADHGWFVGRLAQLAAGEPGILLTRRQCRQIGKAALTEVVTVYGHGPSSRFYAALKCRVWQAIHGANAHRQTPAGRRELIAETLRGLPRRERLMAQMLWGDDPLTIEETAAVLDLPLRYAQTVGHGLIGTLGRALYGDTWQLPPLDEVLAEDRPVLALAA